MITGSEMAVVDENAAALGVSQKQLMESSGNALARRIRQVVDPGASVTILAGRGNNGGDASVAARFLDEYDVRVFLLGRAENIGTEIARDNWAALEPLELVREELRDSSAVDIGTPDLIVDAMLGTGVTGALREPVASAAAAINDADAPVLSVDVPSGLDAETGERSEQAVEADHVVTFHETKPGLAGLDATVTVADIGIPATAELFVERGDLQRISRDPDSHKGENGEVLVIGGGPYVGAPALSARAALRAGADLVRVTCPTAVAHEVQGYSENLIVRPVEGREFEPGHVGQVMEFAARHDALVVGPGLGDSDGALEAAEAIIKAFDGTAVVDADALQVVPGLDTEATLICTPHRGELRKMGGPTEVDYQESREELAAFAREIDATLLVKGRYDLISNGDRTRVNRTGDPGMTVGWTGDVLAGVTGSLAARLEPIHGAAVGAYVNGRAGERASSEHGDGLLATDMIDEIPQAMRRKS
jgi:hydroxyethylthiazole kinase-like uncharacterized protein yjeF